MAQLPVEDNQYRKKRILRIGYVFIGILIFLTFFSNTINNFSLPRVSVGQPVSGALIREVTGEGIIQARETRKRYVDQGRLVNEIKVHVGDKVKKGQILVVLDSSELERQLEVELLQYDQTGLSLKKLVGNATAGGRDTFERDIAIASRNVESAKENLKNMKEFFAAGSASGEDVEKSEMALLLAERELATTYGKRDEYAIDVKNLQDALRLQEINMEVLKRKLKEECKLVSPAEGIVMELNADVGGMTSGAQPLFSIADLSMGFELKVPVDADKTEYLQIGDEVEIDIKSFEGAFLKGKVREIADNHQFMGEKRDLLIDLPQKGIVGGEKAEIYIGKKTRIYEMLVPNAAVGTDENGKFVWVFQERKGPLGSEYYVRKATISAEDSDSSKSAVTSGLSSDESIVVKYSKSIMDGSRVIPDR